MNAAGGLSQAIYYAHEYRGRARRRQHRDGHLRRRPPPTPDIRILEYSGADLIAPVDVTAAATGNSGHQQHAPR